MRMVNVTGYASACTLPLATLATMETMNDHKPIALLVCHYRSPFVRCQLPADELLAKQKKTRTIVDNSVPNDVPLKNMEEIIRLVKEIGRY